LAPVGWRGEAGKLEAHSSMEYVRGGRILSVGTGGSDHLCDEGGNFCLDYCNLLDFLAMIDMMPMSFGGIACYHSVSITTLKIKPSDDYCERAEGKGEASIKFVEGNPL
jgi:hypothetical protein